MSDRRGFIKGLFFSAAGISVLSMSDETEKLFSEIAKPLPNDETVKMVFESLWNVLDGRATTPLELQIQKLVAREIPPFLGEEAGSLRIYRTSKET
jgi:RNAse (barnase) inhibitor barstar